MSVCVREKDLEELGHGEVPKRGSRPPPNPKPYTPHQDVTSLLVEKGVAAATEFDWNSQLKVCEP